MPTDAELVGVIVDTKNPFRVRQNNGLVEVWEGDPDSFEGEFVLCIDPSLIGSLIAALNTGKETK